MRWLFFVPLAAVIYTLAKLSLASTFFFISSKTVIDIASLNDYGGHYILGPLFIFVTEAFSVAFGIYSGVFIMPTDKKKAFWAFFICWSLVILLLSFLIGFFYTQIDWTVGKIVRTSAEVLAQLVGLILAGVYIWRDEKAKKIKYLFLTDLKSV